MWKAQVESAKANRDVHEKDHYEGKHLFHGQRLKLQAGADQMTALSNAREEESRKMTQELQDLRRSSMASETERATQHAAATNVLKESQDAIHEAKMRLKDLGDHHSRFASEHVGGRDRMLESHKTLERSIDQQAKLMDEERRRMVEHLEAERRTGEQLRGELNRERDITSSQLRKMHEDSRSKLVGVEKERARIQEASRAEVQQATQVVAEQQKQIKVLEHDLVRLQALQGESESNAHWVRQEYGHHDRETGTSLLRLEDEVRASHDKLEGARQEEHSLNQHLEAQRQRNEQERLHLRRTLDDLSGTPAGGSRQAPFTAR
jgi:hypothetical protein